MDITVIGAGNQGMAVAAYLSVRGEKVFLYNRSKSRIDPIIESSNEIISIGKIQEKVKVEVVTDNLLKSLKKLIIITVPVFAYQDICSKLALNVDDTYTILLSPGRTNGINVMKKYLRDFGCEKLPCILESQTTIFVSRILKDNQVMIYGEKNNIGLSSDDLLAGKKAFYKLPMCIKERYRYIDDYLEETLSNMGMMIHPVTFLFNINLIEKKIDFRFYYDGISKKVARLLEKIDVERIKVAKEFGCNCESLLDWLKRNYNTVGETLYDNFQSNVVYKNIMAPSNIDHRYLEEDIPFGLVQLERMALEAGIKVPVITEVINYAILVQEKDYRNL